MEGIVQTCPEHGPMLGLEFVDGIRDGQPFGESRVFCVACRERERAESHPWRDNPVAVQLREERLRAGLSIRDTGVLLGVDWLHLNQIQTGRVEPPDDATFTRWLETIRAAARRTP